MVRIKAGAKRFRLPKKRQLGPRLQANVVFSLGTVTLRALITPPTRKPGKICMDMPPRFNVFGATWEPDDSDAHHAQDPHHSPVADSEACSTGPSPAPHSPVPSKDQPNLPLAVRDLAPLLVDAFQSDRTWLKDLGDECIHVSSDLYEVLLAYQQLRRAA